MTGVGGTESPATPFVLRDGPAPAVGVLASPAADCGPQVNAVRAWARRHGLDVADVDFTDAALPGELQLLIVLGGDGTILRGLRLAAPHGTAVLGVNFGHVGFLADVEREHFDQALAALSKGGARVEAHGALRAQVRDGTGLDELAYNDVVLGRRAGHGSGRIIVEVSNAHVVDVVGDGVIVATGLGSTAYNVSAGGPALSPLVDAMVLTSVAATTGPLRSLVLSRDEALRLTARADSAPLTLELDGQTTAELEPGATLDVSRAPQPALLVRTKPVTFYDDLRDRLLTR
jgi:NAD+ kinase